METIHRVIRNDSVKTYHQVRLEGLLDEYRQKLQSPETHFTLSLKYAIDNLSSNH